MINEHVDDKCPAEDKNSAKIQKGTSLAHNLPFPLQREGVSTAEHGPLLYTVNSLKEPQETNRRRSRGGCWWIRFCPGSRDQSEEREASEEREKIKQPLRPA